MAVQGADLEGLLHLAADLGRVATTLGDHRRGIADSLAGTGATSVVPTRIGELEDRCRWWSGDVVRRAALLGAAGGSPASLLLLSGAPDWAAVFEGIFPPSAEPDRPSWWEQLVDPQGVHHTASEWVAGILSKNPRLLRQSIRLGRLAGRVHGSFGVIGFAGDLVTIADPPHDGVRGEVDRAMAVVSLGSYVLLVTPLAPVGAVGLGVATAYDVGSLTYDLLGLAWDHRREAARAAVAGAAVADHRIEELTEQIEALGRSADDLSHTVASGLETAADWTEEDVDAIADELDDYEQYLPGGPALPLAVRAGGAIATETLRTGAAGTRWLGDRAEDVSELPGRVHETVTGGVRDGFRRLTGG